MGGGGGKMVEVIWENRFREREREWEGFLVGGLE